MRWFVGRPRQDSMRRRMRGWSLARAVAVALACAACLVIAACGSPSALQLPAGSFSSATYSFHIDYPRNWKANPSDSSTTGSGASTSAIPFTLVITRTGDTHTAASLVSTCTITVMNMRDRAIAASAAALAHDKALQSATIGGKAGYRSSPLVQDIPNTQISVTHTDYYVVHGAYEYQISTDSVKGDNADNDLRSIIASFAFGA